MWDFTPVAFALFLALSQSASASTDRYEIPTANSYPEAVAIGSDGNVWFTQKRGNKIGRLTPAGGITEFPVPTADGRLQVIVSGPDGNLWFTENRGNKIGRITPSGEIAEFPITTPQSYPFGITAGPDGALWFTLSGANKIGRISVTGQMSEFPLINTQTPYGITTGPDGNLWFTGFNSNTIGRITPSGEVTEFPIPTADSAPHNIVAGPDGALWFTQTTTDSVGRITTEGRITEFKLPTEAGSLDTDLSKGSSSPSRGVSSGRSPYGIAAGRNAIWLTQHTGGALNRITPGGEITEVTVENIQILNGVAIASDGSIWFAAPRANSILRLQPSVAP